MLTSHIAFFVTFPKGELGTASDEMYGSQVSKTVLWALGSYKNYLFIETGKKSNNQPVLIQYTLVGSPKVECIFSRSLADLAYIKSTV